MILCFSCCYLFTNVAIFFYSANCFVKNIEKSFTIPIYNKKGKKYLQFVLRFAEIVVCLLIDTNN